MNARLHPSPASSTRSRLVARGYTAVEVLMAMTLAAVGSAAVIAMIKTSVQSDLDARKTDVANAIARAWTERLRRDAMQWTQPALAGSGGFNTAKLLSGHTNGHWYLPGDYMGGNPETMSYAFDILGRDLAAKDVGSAEFCVQVRLTPLVAQAFPAEPGLFRADVRVLWFRGVSQATAAAPPSGGLCAMGPTANNPDLSPPILHSVYLTTTLRENGQP